MFVKLPMSISEENVMPNNFRDTPPDADVDFDGNPLLPPDCANRIEDKEICSPVFPSYDEDKENKADDACSRQLSTGQEETQYDVKWVPPDGGWGWMVLMGSLIVNILIPGMVKSYGVLFIEFLDVVNATPSSAAWIPALSYWLYSSMGPFASALAIAFSHRKITIIGGILASTGLALSYFATSVWHLCLTYGIIGGLGAGLAYPIGVFMVGDYFTEKRGLANGLCTSGSALGSVVIPPLLRALLDAYGCKTAIVIMAGILLNVCVGALFYDPVEKHLKKVLVPREANPETDEEKKSPTTVPKTNCIEIEDKLATRAGANREVAASLPIAIPTYNHNTNVDVRDLRDHRGSGSIRRATFQIGHDTPQGESWSLKSMDGIGTSPLAIRLMREDTGTHGSSPRTHLLRNRQPQNQAGHSFESNSDAGDAGNAGSANLFPQQGVTNHGQSRLNLTAIPEDDDNDMSPSENELMIHPSDATNRNIDWKYFPEVPPSNQRNMRLSVGGGNQLITGSQQNTSGLSRTLSVASNVSTSSFHYVSTIHHGSLLSALQAEQTVPEFPSTHTLKPVHTSCCSKCLNCAFRKCKTDEVDKEPEIITPPPLKQKQQQKKFIDFSLFKDGIYIIMLLSNSTTAVGYTNFIILLPAYALKLGLDKSEASLLLSVVAGFDFFGRIGGAALSDLQFISRKWFYIVGLFFSGVALALLPMAATYRSLFIYCACFGLASGTYVGVTAVILADELGSEKLGSSYERNGRYQPILRALGIILVIGALFWLAVPVIEHRRKRIAQKNLLQSQKENDGNQVQETKIVDRLWEKISSRMDSDSENITLIPPDSPREAAKPKVDVPVSTFPPSMYRERLQQTPQEIAAKWLELYQVSPPDTAMRAVKEQIRLFAPMIYSPMKDCDCLNMTYNEELAAKKLFEPMELFLSGFEKTDAFFQKLEALEPPATLCGRVFKMGEPTYSCRDCGMDPTCVLCVECFRASAHKQHKYKISTSGGGGYCDCGDPEAWKTNCYCDQHVPQSMNPDCVDEDADLADIQKRALTLFHFALEFCHDMLSSDLHTVLPRDLTLDDKEIDLLSIPCPSDTFGTVMYNDETHTFDTVIQTLTRAVDCTKKTAVDFATIIDREGRSVVKCSNFQICNQVKQLIEKYTTRNTGSGRPLKVMVMQSYVLAHQTFSMQLLKWIQKLINLSSFYRKAFCTAIMKLREKSDVRPAYSILEGVMLGDVPLWKAVRSLWHHLCISGLLKEYETKRSFACTFSKLYPDLMKEFILDDHDHGCSITSLSVQIFTVPTIAHHLIAKEDIFFKIVTTFMSECEQRVNSDRVLEFDRHVSSSGLKRANFCTYDLKYILTMPPPVWDDALRRGFLYGFSSFLTLLSWMENMDSVVRQTLQHMEYEPEWESGFNLHIKLSPVISLLLDWCGSDKNILIIAYRKTMLELSKIYGNDAGRTSSVREYANHSATCIDYDVSRQPVSVHKPLSRFLAGLYLHLEKFNLDFYYSELNNIDRRLPPEILIEPALRTQVLVGQVHANMWRRNGFALLNQMYFYQNVKCRSDMVDKDIISLQMGAAVIESNEFVLHVLDRYALFNWLNTAITPTDGLNEDDNQRNTRHLVEEFLQLMIILVSARYTFGVGQVTREDCIKKEVIQQLCVEPMTHSNLNKALVENVNNETGLETVIDQVAVFKRQATQNGLNLYELKPELYEEYDCFHYHYTREEQSKAEQKQQSRKKAKGEPECFPPPKLPLFTSSFNLVVNILKSDVLLSVLKFILRRECNCLQFRRNVVKGLDANSLTYSDPQIQKVLHLICLGLNEEIVRNDKEPGHFFRFYESAKLHGIFRLLEEYSKIAVNTTHIEMVRHILKLCESACPPHGTEGIPKEIEIVTNTKEEEERQKKAKLAAESRMKMLAKISAAQKSFMAVNADLFAEDESTGGDGTGEFSDCNMHACDTLQALGPERTPSNFAQEEIHICILCQEEQSLSDLSKPFVLAAYVQRSSVLCQDRAKLTSEGEALRQNFFLQERDALFLSPDLLSAPVVSCCGHMMHISCWSKHYENVQAKERRRPYRHPMSFDVDKREYLCPMCDCISNVVIPMTNPLFKLYSFAVPKVQIPGPFDVWIEGLQVLAKERGVAADILPISEHDERHKKYCSEESNHAKKYKTCPLEYALTKLEYRRSEFELEDTSQNSSCRSLPPRFTDNFQERVTNFMQTIFQIGLEARVDDHDYRLPLMLWQGLAFSIIALEEYSRDQVQPFFGNNVPARRELGLTHYIRTCALGTLRYRALSPDVIRSHAVKLVTTLVTSPAEELPCLLECDAFGVLISLTQALPSINPEYDVGYVPSTGTMFDFFICRLTFLFHITQVLITKDFSQYVHLVETPVEEELVDSTQNDWDNPSEKESLTSPPVLSRMEHLFSEVWRCVGKAVPKNAVVDYDGVWESIRIAVIPFLRCCCKFYEKLTGIAPPESLMSPVNSYDDLVKYLGLPVTFEKLFDSRICWQLPYRWASHPSVLKLLSPTVNRRIPEENRRVAIVSYPRQPVSLAPLPHDYIELMNSVSMFTCNLGDIHDSRAPTKCLICGVILCSQSYCCQFELGDSVVGACTFHAYYCGGGKGIFLRIRDCKLFYIGGKGKGCYMLPPYVDEYGETDQGLKRGNPMTLDAEKYEQLRRSWMLHLIPEEIARIVENSTSISNTEWQYL
ncbi:unnamed protein product [Allacma fusca]|uniref:E3 ubiquitin-protein ligase n=1 Tax=Allacma fusca TaxID=39272 RepID=A0A8J2KRX3_9HEXA|nr:unnamed protein product [Allacma fusca]